MGTVDPGTYFGPVSQWLDTERYTTVLINGWWINVWERRDAEMGVAFAHLVPGEFIFDWHEKGWADMEL